MTLLVQNDTGTIDGANSYVSVQEFKDYWTARGVDYTAETDSKIESYLIPALFYLDSKDEYVGYKLNGREQTTEFPRANLYDCSGEYPVLVEGIPREVKNAQCEYSHIYSVQGTLQPNGSIEGDIKINRKKVGPIEKEIEYFSGSQSSVEISYPQADKQIPEEFIVNSSGLAVHT